MYCGSSRKISRKLRGRWESSVSGHQKLDRFGVRCERQCGDANGDGVIDIREVIYIINCVFKGAPPPEPLEAGEANCKGKIDLGDVVYLVNYLLRGGEPPCPPR
jgi:hypothetical protein